MIQSAGCSPWRQLDLTLSEITTTAAVSSPRGTSREDIMRNSRTGFTRFLISAASLIAASTAALAGEQVLEFKLVTKMIDPKIVQAANIDGQTMMTSNAF